MDRQRRLPKVHTPTADLPKQLVHDPRGVFPNLRDALPGEPVHETNAMGGNAGQVAGGTPVVHRTEGAHIGRHPCLLFRGDVLVHVGIDPGEDVHGDFRGLENNVDLHHCVQGPTKVQQGVLVEEFGVFEVHTMVGQISCFRGQDVDLLNRVDCVLQKDAVTHIIRVHHQQEHHAFKGLPEQVPKNEGQAQGDCRHAEAHSSQNLWREEGAQYDDHRDEDLHRVDHVAEDQPDGRIILDGGRNHVEALKRTSCSGNKVPLADTRGATV
mmetsp:Transcript_102114/g.243529  ORF Transcript_102114/g.243529 Transcript_102114/m.243529 type:complete len:268 (-) Transcript_102114:1336-2139(-)